MTTTRTTVAILALVLVEALRLSALPCQNPSAGANETPSTYKASFDCSKVKELSLEDAICKSEELAKLDIEMAKGCRTRLTAATESQKSELVESQKRWLMIRNSCNTNPYHGDPEGTLSDLAEFYRVRIMALRSGRADAMNTEIPEEYTWLRATASAEFSKGFAIGRAYMSCEDPCKKKPALYRWISVGGSGIGEPPGDVDTPFAQVQKKLAAEGWRECRSADDSGKPTVNYFTKGEKIVVVSRYYSMGVGNGIGLAITISGPLPEHPLKPLPNRPAAVGPDWGTYASPDGILKVRYPPDWSVRQATLTVDDKYLVFGANNHTGSFTLALERHYGIPGPDIGEQSEPTCSKSDYQISGHPAKACLSEFEAVGDGICVRFLESVQVEMGNYLLSFNPGSSLPDETGKYRMTKVYDQILSTVEVKQH